MYSRATRVYISLTAAAGIAVVAGGHWAPQVPLEWTWWGVLVLIAACVVTETQAVEITGGQVVSVATIPHLAAALLLPPSMAALVAATSLLLVQVHERAPLSKLIFNTASLGATLRWTSPSGSGSQPVLEGQTYTQAFPDAVDATSVSALEVESAPENPDRL